MSRILITPNELRTSSKKFKQSASEIENLMRKLESELNKLNAAWDGAAQDKFYQHWNSKGKKDFTLMKQECEQFSQKIEQVATKMEHLDRELASQMMK